MGLEGRQREFGEFNTSYKNPSARVRLKVWFGNRQSEEFGESQGVVRPPKGSAEEGKGQGWGLCFWEGGGRGTSEVTRSESGLVRKLTPSLGSVSWRMCP